jgi:hypothetical protein
LFGQLVRRISADDGLDDNLAERVVDQAIAFLAACAHNTLVPLSPSALVDIGWHAFLLHTREYATFCHEVAGRFLHHVPTTDDSPTDQPAHEKLARTVAAIRAAGFAVDADLWNHGDAGDCTGCHTGCHDDPPPARR